MFVQTVRATGALGVPGLYVPADPGAPDESAKQGMRYDESDPLNRAREWRIFVQRSVRSQIVVIVRVGLQRPAQGRLAPDHHVVKALASDRADQPFGIRVLPRKKLIADLDPWIATASASLIASFASGIIRDKAAVCAAITEPWSNGQTEGQITKLKLVKRQMYGRAKIDLLQARLIGAT